MSQSATSSLVTHVPTISNAGIGTVIFTGSCRVDCIAIPISIPASGNGASVHFTFYDIDGNVLFHFQTAAKIRSLTGSWLATNGLRVKSSRTWSRLTVFHSAEGV